MMSLRNPRQPALHLRDRDPVALAGGAQHRVDDLRDLGGVAEVGVERRRAVEAGQQAVDLDQLQVVEAEAVAGRRAERRVVRVLGSGEDGAEAAPASRAGGPLPKAAPPRRST